MGHGLTQPWVNTYGSGLDGVAEWGAVAGGAVDRRRYAADNVAAAAARWDPPPVGVRSRPRVSVARLLSVPARGAEGEADLSRGRVGQLEVGTQFTSTLTTPIGAWSSDRALVVTDWFPPAGVHELALTGRSYLRFVLDAAHHARSAKATIGIKLPRYRRYPRPERLAAPWTDDGVTYRWFDREHREIRRAVIATEAGITGVACAFETRIMLDLPSEEVELHIAHFAEAPAISGLDGRGRVVAKGATHARRGEVESIVLRGSAIAQVIISAPHGAVLVVELCPAPHVRRQRVEVIAYSGPVEVAREVVDGADGDVLDVVVHGDAITNVRFSGAFAAVIDLCLEVVEYGATIGWKPVEGLSQPIALPVSHADYPCPNKPVDRAAAEALALGRITYGPSGPWAAPAFDDLYGLLEGLVGGGPSAVPMSDRAIDVTDAYGSSAAMPAQHPLDLVLLGSLSPAVAQMLGLYAIDRSAHPGETYDYLIVADHDGALGGSSSTALAAIAANGFAGVDAWIASGIQVVAAPPLSPPTDPRAYALPFAGGGPACAVVGLRWERALDPQGKLVTGAPVAAYAWRARLGVSDPSAPPLDGAYEPTSEDPIVISDTGTANPQRPDDWPALRMYSFDAGLDEGWYAYRINGVDIFGRHSARSMPAAWWQWSPDAVAHSYAVHLLDTLAPPTPVAVEAQLLDPADPLVIRDAAYTAWRAALPAAVRDSLVGVRVRWRWTQTQRDQAPDAREFRIYLQPGSWNTVFSRLDDVQQASPTTTEVVTALSGTTDDRYVGCTLRCSGGAFSIIQSHGDPVRLVVTNRGPAHDVAPPDFGDCSIAMPPGHAEHVDPSARASWDQRLHVVPVDSGADAYDVLLPRADASDLASLPIVATTAAPLAYAQIGVSAADDKQHALDLPRFGSRPGNESPVGGPAAVVAILRTPPPPPGTVADSDSVFASPADVDARSYYTFRYRPQPGLRAHVLRALDRAVFDADWQRRPRGPLAATSPAFPTETDEPTWNAVRRAHVIAELGALDQLHGVLPLAAYAALSNDTLRVLAALPGVDAAYHQRTNAPLHPDDPANANRRGPNDPTTAAIDPSLRAYIDVLDGRTRNRFFYRAAQVDGAGNRGVPGVASPPVNLPRVVRPPSPRIARIEGRELAIELVWVAVRDRGVVEYRIYRATDELAARDPRTMTEVAAVAATGEPRQTFLDTGLPPRVTYLYRIVAVDADGLTSHASAGLPGRAFGEIRPNAPVWGPATVASDGSAILHWTSTPGDLAVLVERTAPGTTNWRSAGTWLPRGTATFTDSARSPGEALTYRLRVLDANGNQNRTFSTLTI